MSDFANQPAAEPVPPAAVPIAPEAASSVADPSSYAAILRLSLPLVLSMAGLTIMQLLDGLFLTWHSEQAVAAYLPASMMVWLLMSAFVGAASYTNTFVAQYQGAGRPERSGAAVWQGLWFALLSGALVALASMLGPLFFTLADHPPEIRGLEVRVFQIGCWGAVATIASNALSGFFSGRGDTRPLMAVQIAGQVLHALVAWVLIFGHFGLPEMGVIGAVLATIAGQAAIALALLVMFLRPCFRRLHGTWTGRRFDRALFARLLRFGMPHGMRTFIEMIGWTTFVIFVGRIGTLELAATNIAFRINSVAWMPLLGLSVAVSALVGQAQGRNRPDLASRCTWRGMFIGQVWMCAAGLLFVLAPEILLNRFYDPARMSPERFAQIAAVCVVLLRFVALYCLLDGVNMIMLAGLQGAGDTRWTLVVSIFLFSGFVGLMRLMHELQVGLYGLWTVMTLFVMALALVWVWRFHSGHWRHMRVIEPHLTNNNA